MTRRAPSADASTPVRGQPTATGPYVMGIGFPLLQGLSSEEVKAILAHFGHYTSRDVAPGP